jgi:hypothetical protein
MHESKLAYIQGRTEVHARAPRNQPKTVIEALERLTVEQHVSWKKANGPHQETAGLMRAVGMVKSYGIFRLH